MTRNEAGDMFLAVFASLLILFLTVLSVCGSAIIVAETYKYFVRG